MSAVAKAVTDAIDGIIDIRPQEGPQTAFLTTPADIAVYGGQAFGGKSFALLLDPLRCVKVKNFGAVIFRRNATDLTQEGGLWDEAMKLYPPVGGRPRESTGRLDFRFPWRSRISFSHLQHEDTVETKKGGQIAMIGFDELCDFTKRQFFYMLSRNRSTCGVRPYVRATCNPDPDSWVAEFLAWWIDQETGLAIPERSGVLRWMILFGEDIKWFNSSEEAIKFQTDMGIQKPAKPKSVTFISASRYDNKIGMEKDPDYDANLMLLNRVDRARLAEGNWKIRASAGVVFKRDDFTIIDLPEFNRMSRDALKTIRRWDFAGTEAKKERKPGKMHEKLTNDPDWTVGIKGILLKNQDVVITDLRRERLKPGGVEELVAQTAKQDGHKCTVWIPEDPGQAGKSQVEHYQKRVLVGGYICRAERESGSKLTRSEGYQSYVEQGHVYILRAPWNEVFLAEHEAFPTEGVHDDIVDAASGLYRALRGKHLSTAALMAMNRSRK